MVLVTGEKPRSRALGIGQILVGLVMVGLFGWLALFGGRPRVAA